MKRARIAFFAIVAAIFGWTLTAVCAKLWQSRDEAPTPVQTEKRSAEQIGKSIGSSTAGFGKGFVEGVKDRLKGK